MVESNKYDHYQSNGYDFVNRHTLKYRLDLLAQGKRMLPSSSNSKSKDNNYPRTIIANEGSNNTVISPVTDPFSNNNNYQVSNNDSNTAGVDNTDEINVTTMTTNPEMTEQNQTLSVPSNSSNKTISSVRLSRKEKRSLVKKKKRNLLLLLHVLLQLNLWQSRKVKLELK
jgi:hypothetical protein